LLAELPEHLADMAGMALATGLRAANITGMRWEQVDLDRRMAWGIRIKPRRVARFRFR
jgi:integrase